ncbi:MAG TPA: hypothetical protein VEQ63_15385 [Bryobacteraceae bacterium]|nr:hypothetical protein [Bryobacteraceae bacterium]
MRGRRWWALEFWICFGLFSFNVLLNLPLFLPGESPYRDSIELGYAGMARFVSEHPTIWGWSPLQYGGLPTQFVYLPLLPYLTAALSWVTRGDPVYLYKLVTATFACLGPVTIYLFMRYFSGSVPWAATTAIAYTLFSPLYGLVRQIDLDRGLAQLPWRLHVLTKYGEGPHNAGLTLLPLAWMATWWAAMNAGGSLVRVAVCAVLFAGIVLTNWVAGLALGFSSAMLLLAAFRSPDAGKFRYGPPLAAAGLAYLLSCFWLTPTFIHTIAFNWPADAFNYKLQATQWRLIAGFAAGVIAVRSLGVWLGWRFYENFLALCTFGFGYAVLFFYSFGIDTVPESRRYALEFETFVVLAAFALLRFCFTERNDIRLVSGVLMATGLAVAGAPQVQRYLSQGWSRWSPLPHTSTTEFQVAHQIALLKPQGRILATGGLRFRLNAYENVHQVGGAFESGLRNRVPVAYAYQIRTGQDSTPPREVAESLTQMKALGVEYVVIHSAKSLEHYRDYKNPQKFEGVLERVSSRPDAVDIIYRVPFHGFAHLLRPEELPKSPRVADIAQYVSALEDPLRPKLRAAWSSVRSMAIDGPVPEGMRVVVPVSYDEGWTATQDGAPLRVHSNGLGFMTLETGSSQSSRIRLEYRGTMEQRLMFVISTCAWIALLYRVRQTFRSSAQTAAERK